MRCFTTRQIRNLLLPLVCGLLWSGCLQMLVIDDTPTVSGDVLSSAPKEPGLAVLVVPNSVKTLRTSIGNGHRLKSGVGLVRSMERYVERMYDKVLISDSVSGALSLRAEGQAPSVILALMPPNIAAGIAKGRGWASAVLTVQVYDPDGLPLGSVRSRGSVSDVTALKLVKFKSSKVEQKNKRVNDARAAVEGAYDKALGTFGPTLVRSRAYGLLSQPRSERIESFAVRWAALTGCLSREAIQKRQRLERALPHQTRQQLKSAIANLNPESLLEVELRHCATDVDSLSRAELVARATEAVRKMMESGALSAAEKRLSEWRAINPREPWLSPLDNELRTRQTARKARDAKAAAERKRRYIRERMAEASQWEQADRLVKEARAHFKRRHYDKALLSVNSARASAPLHAEAQMLHTQILQKKSARDRKEREARIRRLKSQVPAMIRKCEAARKAYKTADDALRAAAASGRPGEVERRARAKQKAVARFRNAQSAVESAINAYRQQGLNEAAKAVRQSARPCF